MGIPLRWRVPTRWASHTLAMRAYYKAVDSKLCVYQRPNAPKVACEIGVQAQRLCAIGDSVCPLACETD